MRLTALILSLLLAGCAFTATGIDIGASAGRTFQEGEGSSSNYVGVKANVHYERVRKCLMCHPNPVRS